MKRTTKISMFSRLFAGVLLTSVTLPALAVDDWSPPINPEGVQFAAAFMLPSGDIEVVYFEDAEEAEIEVVESSKNQKVYKKNGKAYRNQKECVNIRELSKGRYVIRVKMNKQVVNEMLVEIEDN